MPEQHGPFLDVERARRRTRDRSTVVCRNGIVCSSQPLASVAGVDVLKAGGNCVDAAIAANAVLGVTEPASCGIGGDLFAILWVEKDRSLVGLNASGRAPRAWDLEKARALGLDRIPRRSPLSWTVPGCVDGWQKLSDRYGRLGLAKSLEAAISYAQDGFPLSPIISTHFDWPEGVGEHMASVYHPRGRAPRYGEVFRNAELAASYTEIAEGGAEAFYGGWVAESIASKARELGGHLSIEDLMAHTSEWIEPVSSSYRGWDVWELPPNGQGIAALQLLNLLEQFDLSALRPNSAAHLHLLVEAKKLVYEDRARYYADPAFAQVPVEELISKEYAASRARRIDPRRASVEVSAGGPWRGGDTVYLTAADADGNMVSLIQSIYEGFRVADLSGRRRLSHAEPRPGLLARSRTCQPPGAGKTPVPHHHPGLPDPSSPAGDGVRRHGRRLSAAGPRPGGRQHDRLRHVTTAGRRSGSRRAPREQQPVG